MPIITISRGTLSGGRTTAECLAGTLGYPCVGRDSLQEAAGKLGAPVEDLSGKLGAPATRISRTVQLSSRRLSFNPSPCYAECKYARLSS